MQTSKGQWAGAASRSSHGWDDVESLPDQDLDLVSMPADQDADVHSTVSNDGNLGPAQEAVQAVHDLVDLQDMEQELGDGEDDWGLGLGSHARRQWQPSSSIDMRDAAAMQQLRPQNAGGDASQPLPASLSAWVQHDQLHRSQPEGRTTTQDDVPSSLEFRPPVVHVSTAHTLPHMSPATLSKPPSAATTIIPTDQTGPHGTSNSDELARAQSSRGPQTMHLQGPAATSSRAQQPAQPAPAQEQGAAGQGWMRVDAADIDESVLQELPADIRAEIEQSMRLQTSRVAPAGAASRSGTQQGRGTGSAGALASSRGGGRKRARQEQSGSQQRGIQSFFANKPARQPGG